MVLYSDRGVVLRTWRLGEADRIVVIATSENGKIRAVAKGVRKTRSKFGGRLEPTSHVSLQLFRGKSELGIVTQAETLDRFQNLRGDPERFGEASAMLEVVDYVSPDESPDRQRYEMLLGALRSLDKESSPLLVPAFFLKLLDHEGLAPELSSCVRCTSEGPLVSIDIREGGIFCDQCRKGKTLSKSSLAVMRAILGGGLNKALEVKDPSVVAEINSFAYEAVEFHLERRLRSRRAMDGS